MRLSFIWSLVKPSKHSTMRGGGMLAALLLPLSGCYVPSSDPSGYAQSPYLPSAAYAPGAGYEYAQPDYPPPGYPAAAYDPYGYVYPGYSYNEGAPTLFVDGAATPLVLFGGGWGYYDRRHNWHHAPDALARHLDHQQTSGAGFHSGAAGFAQPRPYGGPPPGGQPAFHPPEQARPIPLGQPSHAPAFSILPSSARPVAMPTAKPQLAAPPPPAAGGRDHVHQCPPGQRC